MTEGTNKPSLEIKKGTQKSIENSDKSGNAIHAFILNIAIFQIHQTITHVLDNML